ncbi:hypothetical protein J2X98_003732 [Pseudarthrobacter enclensis]|uniref:Uncharacterized protein n=1 Tax=Pseudarthrobacter enclensis TaxID=993070 RepID=A0ABT9RXZ9_9MICC|nr:hypothetical protein [Pseudarthrobacter enclensis]
MNIRRGEALVKGNGPYGEFRGMIPGKGLSCWRFWAVRFPAAKARYGSSGAGSAHRMPEMDDL